MVTHFIQKEMEKKTPVKVDSKILTQKIEERDRLLKDKKIIKK